MRVQLDLLNFENRLVELESNNSLYKQLQECGYVDSHKRFILELLWDLKSHTNESVVSAGGKQYNARIKELRRDGWNIVSERSFNNQFFFRLLNHDRRVL